MSVLSTLVGYAKGVWKVALFFLVAAKATILSDSSLRSHYNFLDIPDWTTNRYLKECGDYVYAFRPWKHTWMKAKAIMSLPINETRKIVELHHMAPGGTLYSVKDGKKMDLLDLENFGRPIVLNFGSCT